jgi:ABC-2 type transport system ATP-binding protein/lipopolysaccharide transport system ATP-binding protein
MTHIRLRGVSLDYQIYNVTSRSLKVSLFKHLQKSANVTRFKQTVGSPIEETSGVVTVRALRDVNLAFEEGDRVGFIGRNGSGKSTLLRVLAGVAKPQHGEVDMAGRVVPLLDKGLGMQAELTGRQNVELPLRLLGASSEEVAAAKASIPEFTGLGRYFDLPIRTYSDGMRTRLTFALSTVLRPDILLLDEWLGAGDKEFMAAAGLRLRELLSESGIVVVASHDQVTILELCNKVVWMENGRVLMVGPAEKVLHAYNHNLRPAESVVQLSVARVS